MKHLLLKKIETKEDFIKYLWLGFSPVGVFVPTILLWLVGLCSGDPLSVGVSCEVGIFEVYPGVILGMMAMSMYLFGAGLIWAVLAIFVWCKILSYMYRQFSLRKISVIILTLTAGIIVLLLMGRWWQSYVG